MKGVAPVKYPPRAQNIRLPLSDYQRGPHTTLAGTSQELCNVWFWSQAERTLHKYTPDWPVLQCDHWYLILLLHRQSFSHVLHSVLHRKIKSSLKRLVPGFSNALSEHFLLKVTYKEKSLLHLHLFLTFIYSMKRLEFLLPMWIQ